MNPGRNSKQDQEALRKDLAISSKWVYESPKRKTKLRAYEEQLVQQ